MTPETQTQIQDFFEANRAELAFPSFKKFSGTLEELSVACEAAQTIEQKYDLMLGCANAEGYYKLLIACFKMKPTLGLDVATYVTDFLKNSVRIIEKFIQDNNIQLSLKEVQEEIERLSKEKSL